MTSYESRLRVPVFGGRVDTYTGKSKVLVAHSYRRVVIGGRGPYVEFRPIRVEMRLTLMSDLEQCKVRLANAVKAAKMWKRLARGDRPMIIDLAPKRSEHVDLLDSLRARKGDEWVTGFHDAICGLPRDEKLRDSPSYLLGWGEAMMGSGKR